MLCYCHYGLLLLLAVKRDAAAAARCCTITFIDGMRVLRGVRQPGTPAKAPRLRHPGEARWRARHLVYLGAPLLGVARDHPVASLHACLSRRRR